jgi:hypothetical protein
MTWEKVWKSQNKYGDRDIELEVFKDENGNIAGAQILWNKYTDKRNWFDSQGIPTEALAKLKEVLSKTIITS